METFKRLKMYYWPYRKVFMWSLLAMLLMTAITVIYPIILQITIDEIVLGRQYQLAAWVSLGFIAVMVLKGTATFFHQYLGDMFGIKSVYRLRNGLYEKLLTLVTIAVLPFLAVAVYRFDKRVHPAFRGIRKSFAKLNTKVQENISGINTVKSLSREDFQISTFNKANAEYRAQYLQTSSIWSAYFPLMEFIGNICIVALLSYGGYLVMQNQLNPGELVAFFSLVNYMVWPIMNLGFVINMFSQAKASGERLLDILEKEEEITDHPHALHKQKLTGDVHFKNVSLAYGKEQTNALCNVSFEANSGKVIGLLGPTGSGKSSVTQLLTRFYSPVGGMITIDNKPITDYSLKTLRSNIGVVLQESFLFSSTIRSNISYGRPDASMEDVIEAAKRAQAHNFIMELPDGYDTMLGERGMGLSGGQKQRIAIARAICLNPNILILDDATSAVDMQTEHSIQLALKEVMKNRTTFIVAHRISSLKHADEILVFNKGRIRERGTHHELLEKGGYYKKIYDLQYRDVKMINEPHEVG